MKQTIKRKVYLLLAVLLFMPLHAAATPASLSIEDFSIKAGETKEMFIDLNCPDGNITLVQFDMKLPTGLSITKEDGDFLVDIAGRTSWKKHSLNTNEVGGVIRFLLASNTNAVISGTSGALISVTLTAANTFNGGDISLENILLVTPKQEETKPATYVYTIEGVVPVSSITLGQSTYELTPGQTSQLSATVSPSNATNKNVTWSSSNTSVATVSTNGLVTAVGVGNAVITCTAQDGSEVKATCSVTVKQAVVLNASLSIEELSIKAGETKEMFIDLNSPDGNITLVQFDMKLPTGLAIAKEDGDYLVDIAGRTTWKKHSLNTSVVGTATRFLLASNTNAVISGTSGALISVTLTAASSFNGGEISLENILLVTPKQEEAKPATYVYTIKGVVPVTSITLSESAYELTAGQTFQLSANIAPSNATDKSVKWSSSNAVVATVSENGLVSAIAAGSAIITCEAQDGSGVKANCSVTVKAQQPLSPIIQFADAEVKRICVENWDTNGDGELSEDEAAAVKSIGTLFQGNKTIVSFKELEFFKGVASLEYSAFGDCENLEAVVIPENVTHIKTSVFERCLKLQSIEIPKNVVKIEPSAFSICRELSTIIVENGNSVYDSRNNCNAIIRKSDNTLILGGQNTIIPSSVTSIGSEAFYYSGLTHIVIPASVTSIGERAFFGCSDLSAIIVESGNPVFDSRNKCNAIIRKSDNTLIVGSNSTIIPSSVTTIGEAAFYLRVNLSSIIIPNSVISIRHHAFAYCYSLTAISIPESVVDFGGSVFWGSHNITSVIVEWPTPIPYPKDFNWDSQIANSTLHVPYGSKTAYQQAEGWKNFQNIVEMPAEPLTLTAKSYIREYGEQNPTFEYLTEGAAFTGTPEIICDAHANSAVGTYPIIIRQGSVDNNNVTFVNGTLTIVKAPLTITAKSYTVKQGEALPQFEADYSGFRNGETSSVLAKQPQLSCSVQDSSEPGTYPIRIYGAEAKNYEIALVEGTLVIEVDENLLARKAANEAAYARLKQELDEVQMHLSEVAVMIAGDDPLVYADYQMPIMMFQSEINAARKALDEAYENVELTAESTTTAAEIMARIDQMKQDADYAQYQAAKQLENDEAYERLTKQLDELQQELDNAEVVVRALGDELYRELVDDITNIKAQIAASRAEIESRNKHVALTEESTIPNENEIRQAISKVLAEADALAKQVVISVVNCSREYGEQNPKFTFNVNGGTLQGEPEIICDARANSAVGTYPVILRKGSITNPNVQFMNGTLTITKAQLTITAKSYTIKQGEALPQFEADYGGFKNGETSSVLTKQPQFSCSVQDSSEPGIYPIRIYGAEAKNYDIEEVDGVLTIEEDEAGYTLVVELNDGQRELFVLKERPQAFPKGSKLEVVTSTMHTSYERSEILMLHFLDKDGNLSEVQQMEGAPQLLIKQLYARRWSISGLQEHESVMVYDLQGRLVQKERAQAEVTVLNLSHLPKGIYIININNKRTIKIQLN